MKSIYLFIACLLISGLATSQVAINATGATPDASTMLDISSPDKGVLITRVALTGRNTGAPITSPAIGLIVFNTASVADGTNTLFANNFYYWTGQNWDMLLSQFADAGKQWASSLSIPGNIYQRTAGNVLIGPNGVTENAAASAKLEINSTSKGVLFPQVSIDSLKDVTSIPSPANGLVVYNTTQPGVRNDMSRGYYWYSTNALSWIRLADNLTDNVWKTGGLLGIQLRDTTNGVEIMDGYTGTSTNWSPKVKILKKIDSALLNAKNNITALVLTGVNRKITAGWEPLQKTSIIFEMNYLTTAGLSGTANNVAISSYIDRIGTTQTTQTQGLAFYVTAPPNNTATADTPSLAMFRHNVGIGAYPTDINNVTEGRLQITGFSNGDQLSLRHPSSFNLKWGLYVSSIDSSLNFYSNGTLRANIDRVTGVFSALSDRRLKKNITPLQPVLANINKLTPYIYNYSDSKDSDRKAIGFMAQDIEPYFPDLVFHTKDRETGAPFLMMTYQSFGVIAIKAIQEQQTIIESQSKKIASLEDEIRKIKEVLKIN